MKTIKIKNKQNPKKSKKQKTKKEDFGPTFWYVL